MPGYAPGVPEASGVVPEPLGPLPHVGPRHPQMKQPEVRHSRVCPRRPTDGAGGGGTISPPDLPTLADLLTAMHAATSP